MEFDIAGQKAYIKSGPYSNQLGIIARKTDRKATEYVLAIGEELYVTVDFQDLVLVGVDVRAFHDWCEQNGYV